MVFEYEKDSIENNLRLYDIYEKKKNFNKCEEISKNVISILEKKVETDSKNSDLYFNFGIVYKNFKKLEIAKKYLKLAIKLNPSKELYYFVLGEIHQQMNEFIDAKENFEQAIKIDPQQALNWAIYGNALQYLKHHALAIMALEKSLQMQPGNIPVIQHLALSEAEIGESKSAIQRLESLLLNNPQNVTLSANYAWVLFRSGNIQKAAFTNRSLLNRSNPPAVLWFNQGIYWAAENNLDSAYFAFDQALLQNPGVLLLESTCKDLALIPSELQQPLRKKIGFDASCRN
jgi:tetratricopeptide (TPR) repeat protein